jgi:hypothetical protein
MPVVTTAVKASTDVVIPPRQRDDWPYQDSSTDESGSGEPHVQPPATLGKMVAVGRGESGPIDSGLEAAHRESTTVAALHLLNARFVEALGNSDAGWCAIHLREDFVCTLADGHRINKREFLQRTREHKRPEHLDRDEVDAHPLDNVALVHGVMHGSRNGWFALARYTIVWQSQQGRWQAVAAQFTPLIERFHGCEPTRIGRHAALARLAFGGAADTTTKMLNSRVAQTERASSFEPIAASASASPAEQITRVQADEDRFIARGELRGGFPTEPLALAVAGLIDAALAQHRAGEGAKARLDEIPDLALGLLHGPSRPAT